ncbi:hypothetical protein FTUN_7743 [Frigoriglobus tundricola]|uniref:CpXC domain-containing protein n=1 Tax=Frigoriglobus tundricola TaxID=2774151 RepID=A0A6M5Z1T0_9BACT|nr:hypothetical protein FTUN_7743 [Frigoriglobus tundricola]
MNFRATCWHCQTGFPFDLEQTPVQRGPAKRPHLGKIIAFYPTCPRCQATVEVTQAVLTVRMLTLETSDGLDATPSKSNLARAERTT